MEFSPALIPFISLVALPVAAWAFKAINRLEQSALQQDAQIEAHEKWLQNHTANFSRRSELETLQAKIDGLASRLERAEDTIDRLRNGSHR